MLSGGAPYASSVPLAVALGATCTLDMTDTSSWDYSYYSYGNGWNGAEWAAPGFGQRFSLEGNGDDDDDGGGDGGWNCTTKDLVPWLPSAKEKL